MDELGIAAVVIDALAMDRAKLFGNRLLGGEEGASLPVLSLDHKGGFRKAHQYEIAENGPLLKAPLTKGRKRKKQSACRICEPGRLMTAGLGERIAHDHNEFTVEGFDFLSDTAHHTADASHH